jgi:NAD dependent epimerase/dehydratase
MNWHGRKVLVTGAAGFIGSHLAERLVALGASVRALVRYNSRNDQGLLAVLPREIRDSIEVVPGDLRDADTVARCTAGADTVFHLAALISIPFSYRNPTEFVQTNVVGTANILDAARRIGVRRVVHTSTSEVYGSAQYVPIDENHPLQPQSPYSASKIAADSIATSYFLSFDFPVAIIRPFNTYGPRQSLRAVIPSIALQALRSDRIYLGRLDTTRDFNFVSDTVEAFLRIAESDRAVGRVLNVGSGRDVSVGEVVSMIGRIVGREIAVVEEAGRLRPTASEVLRLQADASAVRELTGWAPAVPLESGLVLTVDWLREQRSDLEAERYVV